MLKGLEVSELSLSEVRRENEKLRLDSTYFSKPMLAAEKTVRSYGAGHDELGALFSRFSKGVFDINAKSYAAEGVPFLRIGNLRQGVIDESNLAFIPESQHQDEIKTELRRGDIVLSKTAYPAASVVTLERCNTSQDTIATTLSNYGRETYRPEAVVAYLNSAIGQRLLWRQFQGNVQLHLSLEDGRKVPIPRLSTALQDQIATLSQRSDEARVVATTQLQKAQATLSRAMKLENWQPPEPLSYVRNSSDAFRAGRLDAEFFSPKTNAIRTVLKAKGDLSLADVCTVGTGYPWRSDAFIERGSTEGLPFVRIRDCKPGGLRGDELDRLPASYVLQEGQSAASAGDLVVGMDGLKWFYCSLLLDQCYVNQRVAWLHSFDAGYPSAYLMTVINSFLGQSQLLSQMTIAQTVGHITLDDLRSLRIPVLDQETRSAIADCVEQSLTSKDRSTQLLSATKRAVEIAIEDSEAAALAYLDGLDA